MKNEWFELLLLTSIGVDDRGLDAMQRLGERAKIDPHPSESLEIDFVFVHRWIRQW